MKKNSLIALSFMMTFIFCIKANAQDSISYTYFSAVEWLYNIPTATYEPLINKGADYSEKSFERSDIFSTIDLPSDIFRPAEGRIIDKLSSNTTWMRMKTSKTGYISLSIKNNGNEVENQSFTLLAGYLDARKYQEIDLNAYSKSPFQVFVGGKMVLSSENSSPNHEETKKNTKIKVEMGKHTVFVKTLYHRQEDSEWIFKLEAGTKDNGSVVWTLDPTTRMNLDLVQNGIRLKDATISPSGKYVKYSYNMTSGSDGKTEHWSEIYNTDNNQLVYSTRFTNIGAIEWHPVEDAIVFEDEQGGRNYIFKHDLEMSITEPVMAAPNNMSFYAFNDSNTFIIYGTLIKGKKNQDGVNRLDGMEDRWPWYRNKTNLYKFDIRSGIHRQITAGEHSCELQDIHPTEDKILVSQSIRDYSQRPYSRQIMMELDIKNGKVDTLWTQNFGGSAQYSPDGDKLLVIGSAMMFNGLGINLPSKMIANDYDNQAYIFDIASKSVKPLTKDFDPNIEDADWCSYDGMIYFKVEEKTYHKIYTYNVANNTFTEIASDIENIYGMTKSSKSDLLSFYGCSVQSPEQSVVVNVKNSEVICTNTPEKFVYNDVVFGDVKEYSFKSKDGNVIDGYYYLPVDFDSSKKYPMIVYYYGGTSPVDRSFRGRYPKNYYAANGYVVYVLNPAGTTGYGQKYAAEHVNNWGITVADEIIEGVKLFTKEHPFVDSEHIGCMGASYGGFMTELLTTRTDIFAAAISHAGISSIASYWGEGYWGYLYNSVAAAGTFPWDNKGMYVGQSALFNADKINTPLLLLHGTADTNVPEGESIQLYTALKLLGKECELIEIQGQDHHIKDYKKFNKWQKTIMAWWEKWLKDDDSWWNDLY